MKRTELKMIHGELVEVTIVPAQELEPVNFTPVFSKTHGYGGKVRALKGSLD